MKAVILHKPESLELIETPDPLPRAGEVVLRVESCSVCGSDLEGFHGIHPTMDFPRVMGHEYSGIVAELGHGVAEPAVGTRVVSVGKIACGVCLACGDGRFDACTNRLNPGFTADGAYAEYVVVPADSCHTIPEGIGFDEAAVAQPLSIAYHAAATRAQVGGGHWVLVQGCGPIGLGAMMHAKALGATVASSDPVSYRRDLASQLGADFTFDPVGGNIPERIAGMTDGAMADIVIECVGADQDDTIGEAVRSVRDGGLVCIVGSYAADRATVPIIDFKFNEKRMIGSQSMPEGYGPTFDLLLAGRINANRMITHHFPLEGVAEAIRLMDKKADGIVKAIVHPFGV